ncbi:MAG: hypothetical protein ABI409_17970 [Ramlibacter sp.]
MHNRIPSRRRPDEPKAEEREGDTRSAQGPAQQPVPRMPHERDESADSQASDEPSAKRMGNLAHDDVERGLVDTDKGPPLDETYEKLREDRPEGEKKFSP